MRLTALDFVDLALFGLGLAMRLSPDSAVVLPCRPRWRYRSSTTAAAEPP